MKDLELLARVESRFFDLNPVSISISTEGQRLDWHKNYVLGCRAGPINYGPSYSVANLFHEMGHLADRSIDKLLLKPHSGWGYYLGKRWNVLRQSGSEAQNDKPILTEARCFAYQISLMKEYQMEVDVEELVDVLVHLDSFFYYQIRVAEKEQKKAVQILSKYVEEMSNTTHTFDAFKKAWEERMAALSPKKFRQKRSTS